MGNSSSNSTNNTHYLYGYKSSKMNEHLLKATNLILFSYAAILTAVLMAFHVEEKYNRQVVYDMVKLRAGRACIHGTWYPPEWRESRTEFNRKSPTNYCNKFADEEEYEIIDQINRRVR